MRAPEGGNARSRLPRRPLCPSVQQQQQHRNDRDRDRRGLPSLHLGCAFRARRRAPPRCVLAHTHTHAHTPSRRPLTWPRFFGLPFDPPLFISAKALCPPLHTPPPPIKLHARISLSRGPNQTTLALSPPPLPVNRFLLLQSHTHTHTLRTVSFAPSSSFPLPFAAAAPAARRPSEPFASPFLSFPISSPLPSVRGLPLETHPSAVPTTTYLLGFWSTETNKQHLLRGGRARPPPNTFPPPPSRPLSLSRPPTSLTPSTTPLQRGGAGGLRRASHERRGVFPPPLTQPCACRRMPLAPPSPPHPFDHPPAARRGGRLAEGIARASGRVSAPIDTAVRMPPHAARPSKPPSPFPTFALLIPEEPPSCFQSQQPLPLFPGRAPHSSVPCVAPGSPPPPRRPPLRKRGCAGGPAGRL